MALSRTLRNFAFDYCMDDDKIMGLLVNCFIITWN